MHSMPCGKEIEEVKTCFSVAYKLRFPFKITNMCECLDIYMHINYHQFFRLAANLLKHRREIRGSNIKKKFDNLPM